MNKEASQPPYYSVVAPATRPLATIYLLATQRTTRARCEGLGVSDAAKLQLFHEPARGWNKKTSVPQEFGLCSILEYLTLLCSCPFSLMRNQGFDEVKGRKNQGRHQGPAAHSGRPSPMSAGPPRPAQSGFGVPRRDSLREWRYICQLKSGGKRSYCP